MWQLKVDRNENKSVSDREIWGYTLYYDGKVVKEEICYGRTTSTDSRVMCYIRCYTWAFERATGVISMSPHKDAPLKVFFTNNTIGMWLSGSTVTRKYRIPFDTMLSKFDSLFGEVGYVKINSTWGYRKRLVPTNITKEHFSSVTSFLNSIEV